MQIQRRKWFQLTYNSRFLWLVSCALVWHVQPRVVIFPCPTNDCPSSVNWQPSVLWRCWLGVRKSIQTVKIEWWGVDVVICLEWGADFLHMVKLMPLPPHTPTSLGSLKSRLVLPIWYWFTQVVLEKRPLNGCVCVCVCVLTTVKMLATTRTYYCVETRKLSSEFIYPEHFSTWTINLSYHNIFVYYITDKTQLQHEK